MIWQLIAAVFAGLGAAGIGLILRQLSGRRLPRWIVPALGGLGMLAYQIQYEYVWFSHKQAQLPETAEVISTQDEQVFWRPWTYAFPMTTAFSVVDRDNRVITQAAQEPLVEFILYRFEKQYRDIVTHQAYLMNCTTREMLPLAGESHQPRVAELQRVDATAPVFQAVCSDQQLPSAG